MISSKILLKFCVECYNEIQHKVENRLIQTEYLVKRFSILYILSNN